MEVKLRFSRALPLDFRFNILNGKNSMVNKNEIKLKLLTIFVANATSVLLQQAAVLLLELLLP